MQFQKHERFIAANQELRDFLRRAEGFANQTSTLTEGELNTILTRLLNIAPEVGDASHGERLDAYLRDEIAEYVKNLRALQHAVERSRFVILCRRAQLETAMSYVDDLRGCTDAIPQMI